MAMSDRSKKSNLCYLLLYGGTKVCRALFEKRVNDLKPNNEDPKTWTVDKFLQLNRTNLESTLRREHKSKLTIVYSLAPRTTDINLWDVSLLCLILKESCGLTPTLRMYLEQLRKQRNKIAHLNDKTIDDSEYEYRFEKLKECIKKVMSEIEDEALKITIQDMITQLEAGLIPNDELLKVEHAIRMSSEDIKQEIRNEHKETRKIIEKGNEKLTSSLELMYSCQQEILRNQQELLRRFESKNAVENPPQEITMEVRTSHCSPQVEISASEDIVEVFNNELDGIAKQLTCTSIDNDSELSACTKNMIELNQAVNDVCREFKERDSAIRKVEVGCIVLHVQCSSILSLLNLLKDYVNGNLDKSLQKLEKAARSLHGCENLRLETVIYEDEFNRVLSALNFEQFLREESSSDLKVPEYFQFLETATVDNNLPSGTKMKYVYKELEHQENTDSSRSQNAQRKTEHGLTRSTGIDCTKAKINFELGRGSIGKTENTQSDKRGDRISQIYKLPTLRKQNMSKQVTIVKHRLEIFEQKLFSGDEKHQQPNETIPPDILKHLIAAFEDNPESFARIIFFLEKHRIQGDAKPFIKLLQDKMLKPPAFMTIAEKMVEETKRGRIDLAFRQFMRDLWLNFLSDDLSEHNYHSLNLSLITDMEREKVLVLYNFIRTYRRLSSRNLQELYTVAKVAGTREIAIIPKMMVSVTSTGYLSYKSINIMRRWWKDEISGPRCVKNLIDCSVCVLPGANRGIAGWIFGNVVGSLVGDLFGCLIVGLIVDTVTSFTARSLSKNLTQWAFGLPKKEALENAYRFLGVDKTASNSVINSRFRQLALIYHPDKGGEANKWLQLQFSLAIIREARDQS